MITASKTTYSKKHLLGIRDLSKEEIEEILDRGEYWSHQASGAETPLKNSSVCNLFFEPSTRTRFSFELAAKQLGAHVMNFNPTSSSTQKGESLYDTIKTIEAMGVSAAVIRHPDGKILEEIAPKLEIALINAGDGTHEHPSQALLDALTMRQQFGKFEGLKVAIIGDIAHSRVAHSNIIALNKLGAKVLLSGPDFFMPKEGDLAFETITSIKAMDNSAIKITNVDTAVAEADAVMMLRVQKERHHSQEQDLDNYLERYGLSKQRFESMKEHAVIMHPAPFNRNIEIDESLVEIERSLIYRQVANGVAIRMTLLERVFNC